MRWQYITLKHTLLMSDSEPIQDGLKGQIGTGCTIVEKMKDVGKVMERSGYSDFYKHAMMQR